MRCTRVGRSRKSGAGTDAQLGLWADEAVEERPEFLTRQLLTYIGNKRTLLGPIGTVAERVRRRVGRQKLRVLDGFAGSGVVSRYFKAHASYLASNDLEEYAAVVANCFLTNFSGVDWPSLGRTIEALNRAVAGVDFPPGFIEELYAPRDEDHITPADRVFYTRENARRIDNYRRLIGGEPRALRDLLLAPLLSAASVHANTAGVFKGFYKDRATGLGRFGGSGADALSRIRGRIELAPPILSRFECDYEVFQEEANSVVRRVPKLDLAYFDPPYNQHPYGSNYFMLNLIARYERPESLSAVSGIPTNWQRSGYNVRSQSLPLLIDLISTVDASFVALSYNNEGFVSQSDLLAALSRLGRVESIETVHNAFRGSRNFDNRSIHVTEQLYLLEKR